MNALILGKSLLVRVVMIFTVASFSIVSYADNTWNGYHWARMSNPFTLLVVDSVTGDWQTELDTSLSKWSKSNPPELDYQVTKVLDLKVTARDDSKGTRKKCRMVKGQMRVCNASYGRTGWLGIATIGLDSTRHIDRGTAKVNDTYSSYWSSQEEKNHVMCQEIGHILGLGHTSTDGSIDLTCMDYSMDFNSQWPNEHDFITLQDLYESTDGFNTYDDGLGGEEDGGSSGCNAPPGKGCNKAVANDPPLGVIIHRGHNNQIRVSTRADGGLWINFIRLVPREYHLDSSEHDDH